MGTNNKYTIYFEIFGKKMKTTVIAKTQAQAKQIVLGRLKFNKIDVMPTRDLEDMLPDFADIFKSK